MIISCRYGDFSIPEEKDLILTSLRIYGEWAQVELDILANFIHSGNVVIDAGAFVGTHSRAFSMMAGTDGTVHAFEPNSAVYPFLDENSVRAEYPNIIPYPFALGEKIEQRVPVKTLPEGNQGGLFLEYCGEDNTRLPVNVKSLDSLCLEKVDFIKADVEGMELAVLGGAAHTIDTFRPIIFMEVNSLDASYGILAWATQENYLIYGVITDAFNPENFHKNDVTVFGNGKECGLLLIHSENVASNRDVIDSLALPKVQTVDDIALLLLHKPQYPTEVLEKLESSKVWGIDYFTPRLEKVIKNCDSRVERLSQIISDRDKQLVSVDQELKDAKILLKNLRNDLNVCGSQIEDLNRLLEERDSQYLRQAELSDEYNEQLTCIIGSRSWLVTKPLRFFHGLLLDWKMVFIPFVRKAIEKKQKSNGEKGENVLRAELQGVFDVSYYLHTYPDIAVSNIDPLLHYTTIGWTEKRNPNPYFDTNYYLSKNPDVVSANINPLQHYMNHGWCEGRNPSAFFDTDYYLSHYPDVGEAAVNPLRHYIAYGWREGRSPWIYFDTQYYLSEYPDVTAADINPLLHYVTFGWVEGRNPNPYFDTIFYLSENPDVTGMNPLLHFIEYGWREGRNPSLDFDVHFYLKEYPDAVASRKDPLRHYLEAGKAAGYAISSQVKLLNYMEMNSSRASIRDKAEKYVSPSLYVNIKKKIKGHKVQKGTVPQCVKLDEDKLASSIDKLSFNFSGSPEVSIVIPVFNCLRLLAECLLSIEKYVRTPFEIIIADDCSDDERIQNIFENHRTIKYIRNDINLGFLRNVNNSVTHCSGKYIFLLNSDVQLLDDCVSKLLKYLKSDTEAMVTGPKVVYPNGVLQEAGGCIHTDCSSTMTGHGEDAGDAKYSFNRYVDYISGVCLCFEKDLFVRLGRFNEEYAPAYAEDLEFCARVTRQGGKILYVAETTVVHQLSASSKMISDTFKIYQSAVNKEKFKAEYEQFFKKKNRIKVIAFYLPQFHSIKENSYWWGEGYTEWRAVANARAQFKGHYQPHIPSDLGFYDLSAQTEIFEKQASMARQYGIHGFCFYYYNFGNFELLERALELFLQSKADINFCLCWANENWTKTWDGRKHDILCEQNGNEEGNSLTIIQRMERFILDSRYITVDGKPIVLIYRAELIENIKDVTGLWRQYWQENHKSDLYLCLVDSMERASGLGRSPEELGFDAAVDFPVHFVTSANDLTAEDKFENDQFDGSVYEYSEAVIETCSRKHPEYKRFPGAFPSWDNTSRRGNRSTVFRNAHPSSFQAFLEHKCKEAKLYSHDERLLFINAWNEWGEGAHLEPDIEYGHTWLQVVEKVVKENQ